MNPGEIEEGHADDKIINKDEILSVWNTVLEQEDYENPGSTTRNFLMVEPFPAVNHE